MATSLRIQGDSVRGIYRRHGVRAPSGIADIDPRVYPVTSADVALTEVAQPGMQGSNLLFSTELVTGMSTFGAEISGAVAPNTIVLERILERGLWSFYFTASGKLGAASLKVLELRWNDPTGFIFAQQLLVAGKTAAATPFAPTWSQGSFWVEFKNSTFRVVFVDAQVVGDSVVFCGSLIRHWSDVQG